MKRREFITKSTDPFEAEEEIWREKVRLLKEEVIRLRVKCGEPLTVEGLAPHMGILPTTFYIGGKPTGS